MLRSFGMACVLLAAAALTKCPRGDVVERGPCICGDTCRCKKDKCPSQCPIQSPSPAPLATPCGCGKSPEFAPKTHPRGN